MHNKATKSYSLGIVSAAFLVVGWSTDVGKNTSFSNSCVGQEFVQLFVVSDG